MIISRSFIIRDESFVCRVNFHHFNKYTKIIKLLAQNISKIFFKYSFNIFTLNKYLIFLISIVC